MGIKTIEERARELKNDLAPLFKKIPSMVLEIERESKRERKQELDERSQKLNWTS